MSLLGYPAHARSKSPVIGVSHTSLHAALQFMKDNERYTGWIYTERPQPHIDGIDDGGFELGDLGRVIC